MLKYSTTCIQYQLIGYLSFVGVVRETSMLLPEEWRMVNELGHHIVDRLHGGVVIFPSTIVTALLISCSGNTSWSKGKSI